MNRNAAIDHIRIVLTALVVFHHTAITYGGSGDWYWRERENASNLILVAFNATDQSFFMGFFFLLSGYFSARSLDGKGAGTFLKGRFVRLGIPLAVYFFLLSPLTIALSLDRSLTDTVRILRENISSGWLGPGPLWFAEALLLFSLAYVAVRKLRPLSGISAGTLPGPIPLGGIALGLGLISFLLRFVVPVGENVFWLQLGYFPCYIFLFFAGCAAWQARLLENITLGQALPWIIIAVLAWLTLPLALQGKIGSGSYDGGLTTNAFWYALWDPFTGFGIMLAMLWGFRKYWSRYNVVTEFLARRAFAIFIIHPPLVVAFSLLFKDWAAPALVKFLVTGSLAFTACSLIASVLLLLPAVRRVI